MLKNAKIKEKEEEYMAEVRNHLKPHTLQLYALKELYKLDELEVPHFDDLDETNADVASEIIKQFASYVGDKLERHINDKGLTEDTVDLMREVVVMQYDQALSEFISLLNYFNESEYAIEDSENPPQGVVDENLKIIKLIEKMILREKGDYSPLDIWDGFDGDGTSSGEIASWLQEWITRVYDFDENEDEAEEVESEEPKAEDEAEEVESEEPKAEDEAEEVESEEPKAEDEAEEVESEEPKAESEDEWIEPIPVENTPEMYVAVEQLIATWDEGFPDGDLFELDIENARKALRKAKIENKDIVEINKLADDLGVDTVHSSPPCIEEALPIRTDGPIDWNWFFSAVAKSEDRTKGIAEQILALKEEGVIKTKQDFLDTMMFLFYATQTLDKETTEKIVSMFSELR